jgi:hypothetical protein
MVESHPKRTLNKAVKMYQAGARIVDIEQQTGVLRASLYYELKKRKVQPARLSHAREERRTLGIDLADEAAAELAERNQELLRQLIDTRAQLAETEARLNAIRAMLDESTARGRAS